MYNKKTLCDIYIQFMNILDLITCLKDPTGLLGVNVFGHLEYKLQFMIVIDHINVTDNSIGTPSYQF